MQTMTTHTTGHRSGRARLHTCATIAAGNRAGSWRGNDAAPTSMHATGAYVVNPTIEFQGFGTIKRPAQHLLTRTT